MLFFSLRLLISPILFKHLDKRGIQVRNVMNFDRQKANIFGWKMNVVLKNDKKSS